MHILCRTKHLTIQGILKYTCKTYNLELKKNTEHTIATKTAHCFFSNNDIMSSHLTTNVRQ